MKIDYKAKCPEHPKNDGLVCGLCLVIRSHQIRYINKVKREQAKKHSKEIRKWHKLLNVESYNELKSMIEISGFRLQKTS